MSLLCHVPGHVLHLTFSVLETDTTTTSCWKRRDRLAVRCYVVLWC